MQHGSAGTVRTLDVILALPDWALGRVLLLTFSILETEREKFGFPQFESQLDLLILEVLRQFLSKVRGPKIVVAQDGSDFAFVNRATR